MFQRFSDIIISGVLLVILAVLFLPVILVLRFTGECEVFFMQKRIGFKGRLFNLYKFATMLKDSPSIGTGTVTLKNDPRILPFGGLLRKTKINELPQLYNVLSGSMSLIGPRPQTKRCFDAFPVSSQRKIIEVRPGLSGIGSIIFRAEEEMLESSNDANYLYDNIIMPYKGELEEWYVEKQSIFLYFLLLFITIWVILFPKSQIVWSVFSDIPTPPDDFIKLNHIYIKD
jgi:lipopolysaccharide/colanic/teichoic acid biosynthesis glycosyltransferase